MTRRFAAPLALLAFYVCLVAFANHRHLWHDELYTYYIASAPSLADFWKDLQLDRNPPLLYLLSRAAMSVLGNTALAVRLPSIAAFFCASMCLYELVRKRASGVLAVLVFWVTPAFYFATEARPYALILAFFGLATLAWGRRWPLVLAIAIAGMTLSHFVAVLFVIPFLIAEAFSRRLDWPILTALLVPCALPFFFLQPHAEIVFPAAFHAGFRKMVSYYYWSLYEEGWVLLIGICAAFLFRTKNQRPTYSPVEMSFVGGLLALPLIVNAMLMPMHEAFFTRYSVPTLFAIPILFVACVNTNRVVALALCGVFATYTLWHETRPLPKHSNFSQIRPDLPLVAASGLTFLEMDREESPITVSRLYYLTDPEFALKYAHATMFERLPVVKQHFPIRGRVEEFRAFTNVHRQFLVLGTPKYSEDWLLRYLMANHATVELIGIFPSEYKDSQLFLVEI